jgi:hypothetical protein
MEFAMSDLSPNVRVALMSKNEVIALIGVITDTEGGVLTRVDPRATPPVSTSRCDTPAHARRLFNRSLKSSIENGWQIFYDGVPLEG